MASVLSVSELTRLIKQDLEALFSDVTIEGEISNFKKHVSGHWYFNLKDSNALICCTMWKGLNNYVFFSPEDGMQVVISGRITVYPPRGSYQVEVRSMKPGGIGALQQAFEKLKQRLAAEGLFDAQYKKPIPAFPRRIGIVTAIDGAAFRDMISVARRRFPVVELVIAPSRVQGEGAAENIAENIRLLNMKDDIDLIIIGRGGGSLEDLWAFNEEVVARAVFASSIPVISAVGHEIDFTISDFVADLRAPTPSAAMEMATPSREDFFAFFKEFSLKSTDNILYIIGEKKRQVETVLNSYGFRVPQDLLKIKMQQLDTLLFKIDHKLDRKISAENNRLSVLSNNIQANDLQRILKKGFALVRQDGRTVKRAEFFENNKEAAIRFFDNEIVVNRKNE